MTTITTEVSELVEDAWKKLEERILARKVDALKPAYDAMLDELLNGKGPWERDAKRLASYNPCGTGR